VSAAYWRRYERRSIAGAGWCDRWSRVVICMLVGPRCMWCCMGAVGRVGVWSGGVVVASGVFRERAI
jgi:hypothetical protein